MKVLIDNEYSGNSVEFGHEHAKIFVEFFGQHNGSPLYAVREDIEKYIHSKLAAIYNQCENISEFPKLLAENMDELRPIDNLLQELKSYIGYCHIKILHNT